jgi:ribonuclease R
MNLGKTAKQKAKKANANKPVFKEVKSFKKEKPKKKKQAVKSKKKVAKKAKK